MPAPLWSKVLTRLSLNAYRAHRLQEIVRNELLYAYLPAQARNAVTIEAYSASGYAEGRYNREHGFFTWEKELLDSAAFPKSGRVLLTAAGGGREMVALVERGYQVTAFEPSPQLFRVAESLALDLPRARVHQASYSDLLALSRGHAAALEGVDLSANLVWLGWGSFTHLTDPNEQLDLLRAVRELWPAAPVVLSFFLRAPDHRNPNAPSVRVRDGLRGLFRKLGGEAPPPGLDYQTHEGFSYAFDRPEIERLFENARYRAEIFREEPFPHALLLPDS